MRLSANSYTGSKDVDSNKELQVGFYVCLDFECLSL